ncbi:MAG: zinc-ribbon domain-containing protein [Clostridium sp.]|nr:zinc-ribbon domain-containing protein [Clostridium sp.]
MFCPKCGYENNDKNKFCMGCGATFEQVEETNKNSNSASVPFNPIIGNVKTKSLDKRKIIICAAAVLAAVLIAVGVIFFVIPQISKNSMNKFNGHIASYSSNTFVLNDDGTVTPYVMELIMENSQKRALQALMGFGQCDVSDWKDISAVSASMKNTIGLKKDGTVAATGDGWVSEEVSKWKDIVMIASTESGDVAGVKKDGTVITTNEELDVSDWKDIVDISLGENVIAGLKKDGTVVCTSGGDSSVTKYSSKALTMFIEDWKDIVDIEIKNGVIGPDIIALRKEGTIATAVFNNDYDWVSSDSYSDWKDITSISASDDIVVGIKKDGTIVTTNEELDISDWKDIIAVSAGNNYIAGLKKDGTLVSTEPLIEYDKEAVDKILNAEADDNSERSADSEIQTNPETEAVTEAVTEAPVMEITDKSTFIPGIHTGMTEDEMLGIMGYGYDALLTPEGAAFSDSRTHYEYVVNSIPEFNCNMTSTMFLEFNENGKLFNFDYHIGYDPNTISPYLYDENELINEYDKIYDLFETSYDVYWTDIMSSSYSDSNIKKAYSGKLEGENGELWFIVGTDMWGDNSGTNEITLSCEDESLRPLY